MCSLLTNLPTWSIYRRSFKWLFCPDRHPLEWRLASKGISPKMWSYLLSRSVSSLQLESVVLLKQNPKDSLQSCTKGPSTDSPPLSGTSGLCKKQTTSSSLEQMPKDSRQLCTEGPSIDGPPLFGTSDLCMKQTNSPSTMQHFSWSVNECSLTITISLNCSASWHR